MRTRVLGLGRRLAHGVGGCLLAGAMAVPLGPTTTSQAVNQINATSVRPLPSAPASPVARDGMIWVPARPVHLPFVPGTVTVPGHWERRLPDGAQVHVPPLTVFPPDADGPVTLPAAVRPPVEERLSSP